MNPIVETITPTKALEYLDKNKSNRPIRQTHVEFLAEQMRKGQWTQNGASIVFDGNELKDGQHRLWACVTAKAPFTTIVVRGVEDGAFATIDTGRPRTAGDVLATMGEKNGPLLATAARFIMDYKNNRLFSKDRPSNAEVANFVENNPDIKLSVEFILTGKKGVTWLLSPSIMVALHYLMSKKNKELADTLFQGIRKGFEGAQLTDPFVTLREKLIALSTSAARMPQRRVAIFVIKAWNAKQKGERLRQFKFLENEKPPKIA